MSNTNQSKEEGSFSGGAEERDLDPRMALDYARRMKAYCESFNGRDWAMVMLHGSADEQNLAHALDNLTECAAMLMNVADRVKRSEGLLSDMDGWLANTGYGEDHPWRISIRRARSSQSENGCTYCYDGGCSDPQGCGESDRALSSQSEAR